VARPDDISWELVPYSWAAAQRLARELAVPFPVATVLAGRGLVDPAEARAFLDCSAPIPDPFLFGDMEAAVDRLTTAIKLGQRVVVHGDYDADGVTATALMVLGLRAFGLEAESYLPSRFTEGFGLSRTAVESIAAAGPGLLITVDCGVNYPEEVRLAQDMGLDVIVIDHHQPGVELPECPLIHPVKGSYPHDDLCGVGLAFKVLHALHVRTRGVDGTEVPDLLHPLLDLVAVGTVADLAPLRGENRYYVKEGLKLLTIGSRPGLRALSKVAGCSGAVDSGAVSFRIAPRLNAAGRLADASPPLRLLLTDDEAEATAIAGVLHELNGARQDVEKGILEEALAHVESMDPLPPVLVLSGPGWHEGVVGIVASRLVERYHRPVILLGERDGVAKGSGRSIPAYDLVSGLNACSEWLTVYGGHTQAVGLTLSVGQVEAFRAALEEHAAQRLTGDDVRPVYRADAILRGDDISADTATALASLGPFGSGNPRPRLIVVDAAVQQVNVTRTGSHLRCVVEVDGAKARAIGFGMGERADDLRTEPGRRILGVQLRIDEWQGALRPEFQLDRIGGGEAARGPSPVCGPDCPQRLDWRVGVGEGAAGSPAEVQRAISTRAAHNGGLSSASQASALPSRLACDLRGGSGRLAAVAQVLATGESAVLLTCSAAQCLEELGAALPLADLARDRLQCMGRGCVVASGEQLDGRGATVVEWDVAVTQPFLLEKTHVVAVDPPYRAEHVELLRELAAAGAHVHLCYGDEQRSSTARLLKYLVHPRFAMVCVYRALTKRPKEEDTARAAAELAWQEGRVVLGDEAFGRAVELVAALDLEQVGDGGAKIDLATVPLYAEAEAEYEECARLCRIL
jgi:single-stranded-DNA-specific exonuclease